MKRTFTITLLIMLTLANVLQVNAQQAVVTITKRNVKLEAVFNEIERQTNYLFMYNNEVKTDALVSVSVKKVPVSKVLHDLLEGLNLVYELKGNHIIITPRKSDTAAKVAISISTAQTKLIRGTVKDVEGNPIGGASISENGIRRGTTDKLGVYAVRVSPTNELAVAYIGFNTQRIRIGDKSKYDIVLEVLANELEETVVTGYQRVNKKDMVGAYQELKMADIHMPNYMSVDKMLQGLVPGMIVTNSSSRAGSSPSIKIRGTSTLLGDTNPLWVVDGIIQEEPIKINATTAMSTNLKEIIGNQVSWINPMDIETVTVLKDASATAIYGSKASNGVIVITTKKVIGKDRIRVNYSHSSTVNSQPNYGRFNVMNSQERVQFSDEAFASGAPYSSVPFLDYNLYEGTKRLFIEGYMTEDEYKAKRAFFETVNTDWFDLLTRTGYGQSHNLSISGGGEKISLASSLSYAKEQGQEIGNDAERYTTNLRATFQFNSKVRLTMGVAGSVNNNLSFGSGVNPMNYATNTSRSVPVYNESGDLAYYKLLNNYSYNKIVPTLGYNIINERDNSSSTTENLRLAVNADFEWKLAPWLTYTFTGGYNNIANTMATYMSEKTYYIANAYRGYDFGTELPSSDSFKAAILPFGGEYFTNEASQVSYNIQNKLNLYWSFPNKSRLNVLLAQEVRSGANRSTANTLWGFSEERGEALISPTLPADLVPTAGATSSYTGYGILANTYNGRWARKNQTDNFMSFFATASYSYKDRYVINSSVRNDISNRFGQDVNKRFDPTYSFGASWRVGEEPFIQEFLPQLSTLNLRTTYGIQGNALTNLSPDLLLYKQTKKAVFNQYYSTISRIPNPHLSWERTTNWNFGADMVLFKKYSLGVDYYKRRSNAVLSQEVPYEFGITSVNSNGGIIYNRGIEGTLGFTPVNTENLGFSLSFNSSRNWNTTGKSLATPTLANLLNGVSGVIMKDGYAVDGFWSYSFGGLDPTNGNAIINKLDTDPAIGKEDFTSFLVYSGESNPNVTGGVSFNLRYKSFSLASGLSMILGGKTRLASPYSNFNNGYRIPAGTVNVSRDLLDRWQKPGDELITDIPSLNPYNLLLVNLPNGGSGTLIEFWQSSDARVVSSSFLRCRDISLSYRLKREALENWKLNSLTLTGSMNNLFVIGSSRFNGWDPELKTSVMPKAFSLSLACGF